MRGRTLPGRKRAPDCAPLHPGYKPNKWLLHRVKNPYLRNLPKPSRKSV